MITPYLAQQPINDFGMRFSNYLYSVTLLANTNTTLTVPGIAPSYKALIKVASSGLTNDYVWVAINNAASIPAGNTFASTNSELFSIPSDVCREVKAGDVLNFITPTSGAQVSVAFYGLLTNN